MSAKPSELLNRLEAGEEVIIARGNEPIARLVLKKHNRARAETAIAGIRALKKEMKPISTDELLSWRHEGHKY